MFRNSWTFRNYWIVPNCSTFLRILQHYQWSKYTSIGHLNSYLQCILPSSLLSISSKVFEDRPHFLWPSLCLQFKWNRWGVKNSHSPNSIINTLRFAPVSFDFDISFRLVTYEFFHTLLGDLSFHSWHNHFERLLRQENK